eukprot:8336-Pleurochrysis_carterae.AAC.2
MRSEKKVRHTRRSHAPTHAGPHARQHSSRDGAGRPEGCQKSCRNAGLIAKSTSTLLVSPRVGACSSIHSYVRRISGDCAPWLISMPPLSDSTNSPEGKGRRTGFRVERKAEAEPSRREGTATVEIEVVRHGAEAQRILIFKRQSKDDCGTNERMWSTKTGIACCEQGTMCRADSEYFAVLKVRSGCEIIRESKQHRIYSACFDANPSCQ